VWSSQLLGVPPQLFTRPDRLGISLEHVYYRSSRSAGEVAPGRILWYVSGPAHGSVVACSSMVEVSQGPPDELWRRFRRLGVYERSHVREAARDTGLVRALRVCDTEVLARPLPLKRLRELAARNRHPLRLVSPYKISPDLFTAVLKESRGDC
jgi:hypothetical protein